LPGGEDDEIAVFMEMMVKDLELGEEEEECLW
jgi:hypothetical protein